MTANPRRASLMLNQFRSSQILNRCTLAFVLLALLSLPHSVTCDGEPCIVIKRKDIFETWIIPAKSPLCNIAGIADSQYKYSLTAQGKELYLVNKVMNQPMSAMYVSDKSTSLSVVVSRPGLTIPHIFTFEYTDDTAKLYRYKYSFDVKTAFRTTFYIKTEDLIQDGALYNPIYMLIAPFFIGSFFFLLLMRAILIRFAVVLNSVWLIGNIIALNFFPYENFQDFSTLLVIVAVAAIVLAILSSFIPGKWGTIGFGLVSIIVYFLGSPAPIRSLILGMTIIVVGLTTGLTYLRYTCDKFSRTLCVAVFSILGIQYFCFIATWGLITPTEAYMRIIKGPASYMAGTPGTSSNIIIPRFIALIACSALSVYMLYSRFKSKAKITPESKEFL